MRKVCVTRGTWWEGKGSVWSPYSPTEAERTRVGGVIGTVCLCETDEEYVRQCAEQLGASIVEDEVILPSTYRADGPLKGEWSEVARTLRYGITVVTHWSPSGIV